MVNWKILGVFQEILNFGKGEMMKGVEIWHDFIDGLRYNTRLTANVNRCEERR